MPIVAWYWLSNESYMNLVIKDVLPTGTAVNTKPAGFMYRSCAVYTYHFVPLKKQVWTMSGQRSFRSDNSQAIVSAYLNFFRGFEYDPTLDCVAMVIINLRWEQV